MLCLSRKRGESIRIGDAIVKIGNIRGKIVELVIDAPREIEVRRIPPGEERRKAFAEAVGKTEQLREVGRVKS